MQLSFSKHSLTQSWTDVTPGIKSSWPSVFQVVPSLKQLLLDTVAILVVVNQVEIKKIRKISAYLKVITFKVDFNIFLK